MNVKNLLLSILVLCILVLVIWYFVSTKEQSQRFDGYIIWQRESVVFAEGISYPEDAIYNLSGEPIWVVQNDVLDQIYDYSVKLDDSEHPDGPRAIKASFYGILFDSGGYGHLGKYNSKVEISKIIDYSSDL